MLSVLVYVCLLFPSVCFPTVYFPSVCFPTVCIFPLCVFPLCRHWQMLLPTVVHPPSKPSKVPKHPQQTGRLEDADEAKKELREAMGETRKRLRETLESEKEDRRKRRETEAARREALLARRQQLEAMREAAVQEGRQLAPELLQQLLEEDVEAAEPMDVEAPSFELPAELQEYSGPPGDRKAQLLFRQAQQAARRKLDKERAAWQAGARQRQRQHEAAARAQAEAQRALAKEKEAAQELLERQQEALDKVVERHAVRRAALGHDRHHRAYWFGLAGSKGVLYCQVCACCLLTLKITATLYCCCCCQPTDDHRQQPPCGPSGCRWGPHQGILSGGG